CCVGLRERGPLDLSPRGSEALFQLPKGPPQRALHRRGDNKAHRCCGAGLGSIERNELARFVDEDVHEQKLLTNKNYWGVAPRAAFLVAANRFFSSARFCRCICQLSHHVRKRPTMW